MTNADRHHVSDVLYTSASITSKRPSDRDGLMAKNDQAIRSGSYAIIPCVLAP
jgi:hypothetical protein